MATITTLVPQSGLTGATKQWKPNPVLISNVIDFAEALTAKGSALAALDVIEALRIPDDCYVHLAGIQTILADDATTLTLHLGTDVDPDNWVTSYDQASAVAGAYATPIIPGTTAAVNHSVLVNQSIDITFATLTGTLTVGKVRVYALVTDLTGEKQVASATWTV